MSTIYENTIVFQEKNKNKIENILVNMNRRIKEIDVCKHSADGKALAVFDSNGDITCDLEFSKLTPLFIMFENTCLECEPYYLAVYRENGFLYQTENDKPMLNDLMAKNGINFTTPRYTNDEVC